MAKKRIVKNTVAGKRRGSRWPAAVRFACECEMLIDDNVHAIAQRHGVPESTLRGWYKKLGQKSLAERRELLFEARAKQMDAIAYVAAGGARRSVEMIDRRLRAGEQAAARCAEIDARLLDENLEDGEEARLKREKELAPVLGDYPLANYTRVLMSAGSKAFGAVSGGEEDINTFTVDIRVVDTLEKPGGRAGGN